MSTSRSPAAVEPRAVRAWIDERRVWLELEDGRILGFPAEKYRRLRDAPDELLAKVRIEARGKALRWEELDEDLTVEGILAGRWRP
jgi:hypothetical protein